MARVTCWGPAMSPAAYVTRALPWAPNLHSTGSSLSRRLVQQDRVEAVALLGLGRPHLAAPSSMVYLFAHLRACGPGWALSSSLGHWRSGSRAPGISVPLLAEPVTLGGAYRGLQEDCHPGTHIYQPEQGLAGAQSEASEHLYLEDKGHKVGAQ